MNVYENLSSDIANETSLTSEQADEVVSFLSTEAALDVPLLEQTYEQLPGAISNVVSFKSIQHVL